MVLVGLALRLGVMAFVYTDQLSPARDHFAFGFEMGRVARSIALGQGFSSPYPEPSGPTALVPPLYPYLLAGVFRLFGIYTVASALAMLTLNNVFSALTCLPVFYTARIVFGERPAVWAGWAWAFFPYAIGIPNIWIWETPLTTLLLSLLVLATFHLEGRGRLRSWLAYGLLWGVATMSSPAVLSVMPFLWIWIWNRNRRRGTRCGPQAAVAALALIACVSPWLIRNYLVFGRVLLRSNFALEFLVGNDHDASIPESETLLPADNPLQLERIRRIGEARYMTEKGPEAVDFLKRHPGHFVALTVRRIVYVWTGIWDKRLTWRLDETGILHVILYTGISILALWGLWRGIRGRNSNLVPLAILLVFFPVVYYITHADVRYRHPIDPAIVILATYGGLQLRNKQEEEVQTA